jgi:transposase
MLKPLRREHARRLLEDTCKTTPDRRRRDRCQAILMADRGRPHHHIAADLALRTRTLPRWLKAYHAQGLDGLTIQWAPARPPFIPDTLVPEMLTWVKQGPAGGGLDHTNWTAAERATYLDQTKGLAVSERTMRAFCTQHGVRPYRPAYHYLKGDPVQQEVARQDLEAFKKSRRRRDIARTYPAAPYPHVVLVIDKAPWYQGAVVTAVLAASPHLELSPLPRDSSKLQVIERFWKVLRRRATHNRLFWTLATLKKALRNSLCYYQSLKQRVLSVIQSPRKRTKSSAS